MGYIPPHEETTTGNFIAGLVIVVIVLVAIAISGKVF